MFLVGDLVAIFSTGGRFCVFASVYLYPLLNQALTGARKSAQLSHRNTPVVNCTTRR